MQRCSSSILAPCLLAALLIAPPTRAGDAHAPFTITVRLAAPTDNCFAASEGQKTLVSCGAPPQVANVSVQNGLVFRDKQKLGSADAGALLFQSLSSDGWGSSHLYGEYSTRTVQVQGGEYVEMLLSW